MENIVQEVGNWTPSLIVSLIKEVIWPITVLILGLRFKNNIAESISKFFSKNAVTEVSATATGVTAKFQATQQSTKSKEIVHSEGNQLPDGQDYESIKKYHEENSSNFSQNIVKDIQKHLTDLNITNEQKIELLTNELSLSRAALQYFEINKILFRSQFDLFNGWLANGTSISDDELKKYFNDIVKTAIDYDDEWDYIKYIAYPTSARIIEHNEDSYKLTDFGNAYITFMKKNMYLVDELAKL